MKKIQVLLLIFSIALNSISGLAGDAHTNGKDKGKKAEGKENKEKQEDKKKGPTDETSETDHTLMIGDEEISYKATAGTLVLKNDEGKARASVFYIAYTKKDVEDIGRRPIMFSFNGGPGSSSVWLHLGLLGPRRVLMDDSGNPMPPPYRLVDNHFSLLDETDLVFIDPVSTGYSRAAPGEDAKNFHGLEKDLVSVGEFIRLYITRNQRWSSPKFLIGESYGTIRAAGLARELQDRQGMYLNGIILVSSVLNFQTISFDYGNDLPFVLFLPGYTATAWYHQKLSKEMQEASLADILEEVEAFAYNDYLLGLMKGSSLGAEERDRLAKQLSIFTGLTEDYIQKSNLRVNIFRFAKELMRDDRQTIGRFDSRILGIDRDWAGASFEYDPSYAAVYGAVTSTLNDYLRTELQFESDLPYEIISGKVRPWNYGHYKNQYVNVTDRLTLAMAKNPSLKVSFNTGYFDLATPYMVTNFTVDHLGLDPRLAENVSVEFYEAGHMMYFHKPSLIKMKDDLRRFVRSALPEGP